MSSANPRGDEGNATVERRVLVVEDDEDLRDLLTHHLRQFGCDVTRVDRGEDALPAARRLRPQVAFVDLLLPGMSGSDVIDALRQDPLTADCTIVVTSVLDPCEYPRALAMLPKPFTRGQVGQALEAALGEASRW
jgi:CheY-like chemotaxis protein